MICIFVKYGINKVENKAKEVNLYDYGLIMIEIYCRFMNYVMYWSIKKSFTKRCKTMMVISSQNKDLVVLQQRIQI